MERGAIQVKRNNDTGKEMWRPMPRKDLMNRNDAEIVSTSILKSEGYITTTGLQKM